MVFRKFRNIGALGLLAILAACNSTDTKGLFDVGQEKQKGPAVVQGTCPQIVLRDGTAFHRVYARGARKMPDGSGDPSKLIYQASLANTTRECRVGPEGLIITVQAQGRIVAGPAGKPGNYQLPIRVAVADDDNVLYAQLTQFDAEIPQGALGNQFLFTKADVVVPAGAGQLTKIYIGFDEHPGKKK